MGIVFVAILLGLIPASIAKKKGRSFIGFWIYGALFFIIALPHALLLKANKKALEKDAFNSGVDFLPALKGEDSRAYAAGFLRTCSGCFRGLLSPSTPVCPTVRSVC